MPVIVLTCEWLEHQGHWKEIFCVRVYRSTRSSNTLTPDAEQQMVADDTRRQITEGANFRPNLRSSDKCDLLLVSNWLKAGVYFFIVRAFWAIRDISIKS